MGVINIKKTKEGISVSNEYFEILHSKKHGGAWVSIIFKQGSRKNLLKAPAYSSVKFCKPNPHGGQNAFIHIFKDTLDTNPALSAFKAEDGSVTLISEGYYKDENGGKLPLKFKHTWIYNEWGHVKALLEIDPESPVEGVVEFRALNLEIREGMDKFFAKHHPRLFYELARNRGWMDLPGAAYTMRSIPSYVNVIQNNVEGIEVYPGSELAGWDYFSGFKQQGLYQVFADAEKTTMEFNAYCMVHKRIPMKLSGIRCLELNFGLPFIKPREKVFMHTMHAAAWSDWISDKEIKKLAGAGVTLMRFHCDYREDGVFWRDGVYPPFDKRGMKELKRVINACHRNGIKIVPYISLKEFHPSAPDYEPNAKKWARMETYSGEISHSYTGSGEFGGGMCMRSGWLDFRKKACEIILSDLPWDGFYFDWCTFHGCRNPEHAKSWHTDANEHIDFMLWCRKRVGPKGILFTHISANPSFICENLSDLMYLGEVDEMGLPGGWPVEHSLIPITQRSVARYPEYGTRDAALLIISGMLEGHGPVVDRIPKSYVYGKFKGYYPLENIGRQKTLSMYNEARMLKPERIKDYSFFRASLKPIDTCNDRIYAALYEKHGKLLFYAGNLSDTQAAGFLKIDLAARGIKAKNVSWLAVSMTNEIPEAGRSGSCRAQELSSRGIPCSLKPWTSILVKCVLK